MNNNSQKDAVEQLLRKPTVKEMVGNMPDSTLYYLMNQGDFPKPLKLGRRTVAWKRSEIEAWIQSRERAMETDAGEQPTVPSDATQRKTNIQGVKQ